VLREVAGAVVGREPDTIALITHPRLLAWYGRPVVDALASAGLKATVVTVPPGERSKSLASAGRVLAELASGGFTRGGVILALGGGVIGDLAGFAAAVYHRGARFMQIPTTLLAQVDASVGGKVGVDLKAGKNLVGAFLQPLAVFADTETLATLPRRHLRNGVAEALKHGFILRAGFVDRLLQSRRRVEARDASVLAELVAESVEMKAQVVAEDERDLSGSRARLNFGHTVGHAIEAALGYRKLLHGEAVSIGMVAEARVASRLGLCPRHVPEVVERALEEYSLPVTLPPDLGPEQLVRLMRADKKTEGGKLSMALPREVGSAELVKGLEPDVVRQVLREMSRHA
jgi:3-dehydroquinate synthase